MKHCIYIEEYSFLNDQTLTESFIDIISKLPILHVIELFSSLNQSIFDFEKKSVQKWTTFNFLLNRILSEDSISTMLYDLFTKTLTRFIWLENETGVKLAIDFLCKNIEKNWDSVDVISFVLNSDNGCLGDFDSSSVSRFSSKILPLIVNPLLKAWIEGAANLVNWERVETTSPVVDALKLKFRCVTRDVEFVSVIHGMIDMFASLFKLEKKWPGNEMTKACLDSAAGLCKSYPFKVLRELVALLYFFFIKEGSVLKSNCPSCSNVFRDLCKSVRARPNFENFVPNAETNQLIVDFLDAVSAEPREEEMLTDAASQVNPERGLKRKLEE